MKVTRTIPALLLAAVVAACDRSPKPETEITETFLTDSVSMLRSDLAEQAMQAAMFVNEVNKELAKARSLASKPTQLQTSSELADVNAERTAVLTRVGQLVERLEAAQGRLAGLRKQIADKDSALALRTAEYEQMLAEANREAERQRVELQGVIDDQAERILTLAKQVDTLSGTVGQLETEKHTVYVAVGTKAELIEKGVLVPEGRKRFLVMGPRRLAPARDLDPTVFTKLDRRTDSTIFLPDGVYRIMSRQNAAYVTPEAVQDGKVAGALKIEDPERFWNPSRYLILVRS